MTESKTRVEIRRVAVDRIRPTPENEQLYRPVDPNDRDVRALAESIREHGVREPLVITRDGYILSGHRRWTAAKLAGLHRVPCRTDPITYEDADQDEVLRVLREYNRQRVKSLDEMLREEVVSVDRDAAYGRLLAHRQRLSDMSDSDPNVIDLAEKKGRREITKVKAAMLDAVKRVIEERRNFWPLSDRQIHYCLLNDPPMRNTKRPGSEYRNDRNSYGDLCDLLTRARLAGMITWDAIGDETRPVTQWRSWANPQDFIREQLDGLFAGYCRNLQRSQPSHVEIVAEKLTVQSIVERVAGRYGLPVTIGRGYCSITPRKQMAERFWRSGKDRLVVLILSDHDPDGEAIAESFARSMRDDFGIGDIVPIRVALTREQVIDLDLPPSMEAKRTSGHYDSFTSEFGDDVYELEAVRPEKLQELLTEAIEQVLDTDVWDEEIENEEADAEFLEGARQRACIALGNMQGCA